MGQITIYLDNKMEAMIKEAAKAEQLSVSKWISRIIKEKIATEWPSDVIALAGSWQDDFPSPEELRSNPGKDHPREDL